MEYFETLFAIFDSSRSRFAYFEAFFLKKWILQSNKPFQLRFIARYFLAVHFKRTELWNKLLMSEKKWFYE